MTPVDVNANRSDPDTFLSGGLVEFDGITNPVVAFQGSGTADIPHLVIYLNTTGFTNIQVSYNARDIDNGTGVDSIQQVNTQYRVGGTGDYANVTGGYIADASAPGGATMVTPVNVTLPANANNQPLVEVRIMTGNAAGSDEFIGIDDISITGMGGNPTPTPDANVDFNGDGKSDWVVTRVEAGLINWFININGTAEVRGLQWGLATDRKVPADYDGDGKDDIAIWRPVTTGQPSGNAFFYILQSETNTVRIEDFGQNGDDWRVVGDYDGDGKDDPAVYRTNAGGQNFFYFRASSNNPGNTVTFVPWGSGIFARPNYGDYDGDGKADFCIQSESGVFSLLKSSGGIEYVQWGSGTDILVPGDFDGDGKYDFCVVRGDTGNLLNWYILERDGGGTGASPIIWGLITDTVTPGDYDGDGKQDVGIWRPSTGTFYIRNSTNGSLNAFQWGILGDNPEAVWYVHQGGAN